MHSSSFPSSSSLRDRTPLGLQARSFSMPRYAGQRPAPAYRLCVSSHRGKIYVIGGVGSDGHLSLLDTGLNPPMSKEGADGVGGKKVAPTSLDADAAAVFASEHGGGSSGKGLDATAASQLVALLQELGLNKYARLFLRQEVDVDSLLQLSDADLKDMGLVALGARRKLTAAIHRHKLQHSDSKGDGLSQVDSAAGGPSAGHVGSAGGAGAGSTASSSNLVVAGEMYRNRYKLNGKTYIGGSARVVLGEDTKTGAPIAIKVHS